MAKKEQVLYTGFVQSETGVEIIKNIDMCNLPHDLFGPEFPLEILGSVDMGPNNKRPPLPNMAGVKIYGSFDCSYYQINKDTVLPQEIVQLVCLYSFSDLGILIDKIPSSVQSIVVQNSVLNTLKRASTKKATPEDTQKLSNARAFYQAYPHITVTDKAGKQTLAQILQEIDSLSVQPSVPQPKAKAAPVQTPVQTADDLSAKDLEVVCATRLQAEIEDMERYVRLALKNFTSYKRRRQTDNVIINCIHKDNEGDFINAVRECIADDIQRQTNKVQAKSQRKPQKTNSATAPIVAVGADKCYYNGKEIHTVKIKKYISKTIWSVLGGKYQPNALLKILQDIQDINVDQSTISRQFGAKKAPVIYIKDKQVTSSSTIEFKSVTCLAQSDGNNMQSRVRILWGVDGNVFVCQEVFWNHDKKNDRNIYIKTIRRTAPDVAKLDLKEDFLLVSDLIKELTKVKEEPEKSVDALEPETPKVEVLNNLETVIEPEQPTVTEVADAPIPETPQVPAKEVPVEPEQPTTPVKDATEEAQPNVPKRKRQRITTEPKQVFRAKRKNDKKVVLTTIPQDISAPTEVADTCAAPMVQKPETGTVPQWVNLGELHAQFVAKYFEFAARQGIALRKMAKTTDTDDLIGLNNELHDILNAKREIEKSIAELERHNTELQKIQKMFNDYTH